MTDVTIEFEPPATASPTPYPLHKVTLTLCEGCINAVGDECHTPGCDLFLHAVDIPILAAREQVETCPCLPNAPAHVHLTGGYALTQTEGPTTDV